MPFVVLSYVEPSDEQMPLSFAHVALAATLVLVLVLIISGQSGAGVGFV